VEFESEEDCADAIENMEGAELFGKVLRCNIAKPMSKAPSGKAIWSADEWFVMLLQLPSVITYHKVFQSSC
jgi:peptidyl-prolyl isomerase E (cyclophilin E)